MGKLIRTLLTSVIVAVLLFASLPVFAGQTIQICAAASFTDVFNKAIIPAFTKKTGIIVSPTFGATGLLARQVESGAPYEVFVSADATTLPKLAGEKDVDPASIHIFTVGRLVLWSSSVPVDTEGMNSLTDAGITNIAVANPKTAPYGAAAVEALTNSNLLTTLQPKIVYAENVNQAFQYAQSGNAEIAFTAYSLVVGGQGYTYFVPNKLYSELDQSVGLTTSATPQAQQFEDYLRSKDGQKLLAAAGYLKPPKGK